MIFGWKEAAGPEAGEERLISIERVGLREQHDEGREVVIFAAETVADPCAETGAAGLDKPGLDESDGGVVIDGVGVDGFDESDVVGNFGSMWEEFAELHAVAAGGRELKDGRRDGERVLAGGHAGDALALADGIRQFGAGERGEFGFVIEEIDLRGRAGLVEIDDAFGFGWEVREAGEAAGGRDIGTFEEGGESGDTDAFAGAAEELAAG